MSSIAIGFASIAAVLVLLALRAPIGVALGLVSLVGIWMVRGFDVSVGTLRTIPFEFAANWSLSAIPMFILMGAVAHHSGITVALFRAARLWLGRLPGGLAVATNFACAGFAAASGSSVATSAAMGRIAIPEMIRQGYDKGLATGVVTSAGTLGALIPPSILFILYGIFAEQSITRLLIAGILPGLLTAGIYAVMIVARCKANPALAPKLDEQVSTAEKWNSLAPIWPLLLLIVGIIGGLYSGLVTPTEAGAFGAFLAFIIVATQGRLTWQVIRDSVIEATSATARLLFVAVGAILLSHLMALTGVPAYLGSIVGEYALDPLFLVIGTSLIYIILGMFLDPLGILLLTLPILLPMFEILQLDLIWLGVLVVKYLEIGLLTPPVGFQVYVVKSVVGDEISLETIFRGVGWFLACEVVIMTLLIAFPQISLLLPNLMYN
ncbi:MAG: TRAP transporter large permease subunit [Rhodospirillales bacterium]|nr:C4-dicarboxylate ABC transporter [Rhodospirillaceae bacterium]MDP6430179.1 TRAP transporter large permease subunit [Rhodospirillales bacterium]MDP6642747.1 TRAP transporter large permease subunit [Rhodospirillales bacterium]MDP6842945.1 TRAP transporter large permease subunit [Rhodospirillales bacterium]